MTIRTPVWWLVLTVAFLAEGAVLAQQTAPASSKLKLLPLQFQDEPVKGEVRCSPYFYRSPFGQLTVRFAASAAPEDERIASYDFTTVKVFLDDAEETPRLRVVEDGRGMKSPEIYITGKDYEPARACLPQPKKSGGHTG